MCVESSDFWMMLRHYQFFNSCFLVNFLLEFVQMIRYFILQ